MAGIPPGRAALLPSRTVKLNALKHAYVRDENRCQAIRALGEDPEQLQTLTNVYENKRLASEAARESWKVIENKDSCPLNTGMSLKTKGVHVMS